MVAGALVLLLVAVAVSQGTWVAAALGTVVALGALIEQAVEIVRDL